MPAVRFDFRIEKASPTGRYVSGWLSVVEKDGKPVEDSQGDIVAMEEVRKAFHKYMRGSRVIKSQHAGDGIGDLVECVIVDDDFAKAHGVTHGQRGVWGTAEITDEKEQARVRKGEYGGFSIGGRGKRTEIKKAGRFVTLGSGRKVGLGAYTRAWRQAKKMPSDASVRETPSGRAGSTAGQALREFRAGMHDRINRHVKGHAAGRKWGDDYQAGARHAANNLRAGVRLHADAPKDIQRKLSHRTYGANRGGLNTRLKKSNPGASDVHVDGVMSTKKPLGGNRVRFTLSKRARLARRALQR